MWLLEIYIQGTALAEIQRELRAVFRGERVVTAAGGRRCKQGV